MQTLFKIRNNLVLASIILLCGIFCFVVGLLLGDGLQLMMGTMFSVLGVLQYLQPIVVVTEKEFQLKNALGIVMRRMPYTSASEIQFEGYRITIGKGKIPLTRFAIHKPDFMLVYDYFTQKQQQLANQTPSNS